MTALRSVVLMAVVCGAAATSRCNVDTQIECNIASGKTMTQCKWIGGTCDEQACSSATYESQCKAWYSPVSTSLRACEWNDGQCIDPLVSDIAEGIATFVIVLIVIGVLIVIAIIACIVCCCCMGARAVSGGQKETVVVQQPHNQAYQQM